MLLSLSAGAVLPRSKADLLPLGIAARAGEQQRVGGKSGTKCIAKNGIAVLEIVMHVHIHAAALCSTVLRPNCTDITAPDQSVKQSFAQPCSWSCQMPQSQRCDTSAMSLAAQVRLPRTDAA